MASWRIPRDGEARAGLWHRVRERRRHVGAMLLLALLPWVEPASAQKQKEYSLTVSLHEEVRHALTQKDIQNILENASKLMRFRTNKCPVKFKLKGPIQTFTSKPITDVSTLEAVHSVDADVKVVRRIYFCRNGYDEEGTYSGCAWRPDPLLPKTVIVSTFTAAHQHVWVHEFGHTTGLPHRIDDEKALMTACPIKLSNWRINQDECSCLLKGPGKCLHLNDPIIACPTPSKGAPLKRGPRRN
jgi:hypothetical protein